MTLQPGSPAPLFTLKQKTADGLREVALADYIGRKQVVLLFFPLAFTSVCTTEMCEVTSGLDAFADLEAEVLALSVDSPFAQEAWAQAHGIRTTILSDFNKEASAAYGVLARPFLPGILDMDGVAHRSAFVIGLDGRIRWSWVSQDPKVLPPFAEIKSALRS